MKPGLLLCLIIPLLVSACTFGVPVGERGKAQVSANSSTKKSKLGNPSSYVVFGKRYYVLDSSDGFVQRGTQALNPFLFRQRAVGDKTHVPVSARSLAGAIRSDDQIMCRR